MNAAALAFALTLGAPAAALPPTDGARTTVLVFEGNVEMTGAGGSVVLGPGEGGVVGADGLPYVLGATAGPLTGATRTLVYVLEGIVTVEDAASGARDALDPGEYARVSAEGGIEHSETGFAVGRTAPDVRRLRETVSDFEIRALFQSIEERVEALRFDEVVAGVVEGATLEGQPYAFYLERLVSGAGAPARLADFVSIEAVHRIQSIRFTARDRATVEAVGSASIRTALPALGDFTLSGSLRVDVARVGGVWRIGDCDVRAFLSDHPIFGPESLGIDLR